MTVSTTQIVLRQYDITSYLVTETGDQAFLVGFNYHSVFRELFLNEDHLLYALHDEVTAGVERAFFVFGKFFSRFTSQMTVGAPEHDRHPASNM